ILGMGRHEIRQRIDEIVQFAGVEQFIDVPVKRYSSGMYLRLAFAVAAYLNCDIMLLDEVLAVGDVAFQQRCLARVGEMANDGRTVLFVSHNLTAVRSLCRRVLVLQDGMLAADGPAEQIITDYLEKTFHDRGTTTVRFWSEADVQSEAEIAIL